MKLQILTSIIFLFVTHSTLAATKEIQPCSSKQMKYLNESITNIKADGTNNIKLMKNANKEILGYYAWEKSGEESMSAEICESVDSEDSTIANNWFYWEGDADPSSFRKNKAYEMTQDEGMARLKVLQPSKSGNITAELSVIGWDGNGKPILARRSIVTFEDIK